MRTPAPEVTTGSHDGRPWRSRGYLPHLDRPGQVQSLTFRLADSLPAAAIDAWQQRLQDLAPAQRPIEMDGLIEDYLDQGKGACHLRDPRIARIVEDALLHFDGTRYRLVAWCVMPNHVHSVIETRVGFPLDEVLHSWKSFTSKEANRSLRRRGRFWQREYHDRFIRDEDHLLNALRYVEHNPVTAGLVGRPEDWRWGSARRRVSGPD